MASSLDKASAGRRLGIMAALPTAAMPRICARRIRLKPDLRPIGGDGPKGRRPVKGAPPRGLADPARPWNLPP